MDTSDLDVPNSRAIAKQLLTLSQDPDNQPFIVQEQGCLAGLVGYIDHPDVDVVLMSTRTLQFLSSHPQNKEVMRDFKGLVPELSKVFARKSSHTRAREFAGCTLDNLGIDFHRDPVDDSENKHGNSNEQHSMQQPASEGATKKKQQQSSAKVEYNSITLQIDGLEDLSIQESVEKKLLDVKGVVSVVLDQHRGRVTVGTRCKKEDLLDALQQAVCEAGSNATPWPPQQRNDNDDLPEYLDEDDYNEDSADDALTRWGIGNSLSARLEMQEQEEEKLKQTRIIGKVSNALQNAGSWLLGW